MKHFVVIVSASLLALPLFGQEKSPQLKDEKDKYSYSMGMSFGFRLENQKAYINPDIVAAGLKDLLAGKPQLTEDQAQGIIVQFSKDMAQKQKDLGEKNKTEGAKFLEENKKKPGVKTTSSGLQYKVEKEGTGPQPKPTDIVTLNYHVSSIDGTEFDAYNAGRPTSLPVNGSMRGWTKEAGKAWGETLQLMKVGSKYQLFVPSNFAYGERSTGEIGPNETLIFDVELLDTKPRPTPPPQGAPQTILPFAPKASPSPK
jgi:FKBP-type peptidyl-prolyl cis-trans isomerase FklB